MHPCQAEPNNGTEDLPVEVVAERPTHMSSKKTSPPQEKVWTWDDMYRSHLEWCNMHLSCIVCNIEKERSQNLHKSMATLTLDAIENHLMLTGVGMDDSSRMQ